MSAFIPQLDPDPDERELVLERARADYRFNYNYVSPLAIIDRVPVEHEFSFNWLKSVGQRVVSVLHNQLELEGDTHLAEFFSARHSLLSKMLECGTALFIGEIHAIVTEALRFTGRVSAQPVRATDLEDFSKLFRSIGLPPVAQTTKNDGWFAHMRVAGPNPVMLHRVASLDDRFPVTEKLFRAAVPGDSMAAAGAEGRLFLVDYQALDGAEPSTFPNNVQKYMYAPLALFVVDKKTRDLRPVAIQCQQTPGPDNPIFTPDDGYNWLIAKTIVEIADGNVHEPVTHLARTHLLIEPFVVCTFRQLAPNHPLFLLLVPHFEGTLAINDAAWRHLIANKGAVDKLCAGTIRSSCKLAAQGVQSYLFNEAMLPRALASRGVADSDWLVNYPYRDDATLYWGAIHKWVYDYLSLYYPTDAEVADDVELSEWLYEIGAEDGGKISGFGMVGSPTLGYLIEAVTMIIYTCSVQHAAVNFPQYDLMSYVPNMPLASYAPAPKSKKGATAADHLAILPPLDVAELQMELGYMLGTVHYTTLGHYSADHFDDPRVAEPLKQFKTRLEQIGNVLDRRNEERRPYPFLAPSGIPQSINI